MRVWPSDTDARLRELWAIGLTTAAIATELGVTKNAVIGRARRLKVPKRPHPIASRSSYAIAPAQKKVRARVKRQASREAARGAVRVAKPKPERMPGRKRSTSVQPPSALPDMAPDVPRARVRVATKPEACCWPIGEPGRHGFRYCDTPTARLYCAEHAAIAYVPARERAA